MYCKECGTKLHFGALFCQECEQLVSIRQEPVKEKTASPSLPLLNQQE